MTEQKWLEIYRETVRPLYGYMAKRTHGDRELTEDIVQESYLRALNDWQRKSPPDSPLAWLKRVARNLLIDYSRKKKWDTGSDLDRLPGRGKNPEDGNRSLDIFAAIASLGRKRARILEAFYYEGMSVREIAEEMTLSERAVEGQLRRARRSLKARFPELKNTGGHHE